MSNLAETALLETERRGDMLVVTASGVWSMRARAAEARNMNRSGETALAAKDVESWACSSLAASIAASGAVDETAARA